LICTDKIYFPKKGKGRKKTSKATKKQLNNQISRLQLLRKKLYIEINALRDD
jgi:hypothetical protein